ncbi:hypothetical protein AB1Y20_006933 [Prymnesium parvum]|uniref:C2 domain-containing protein n=1 Tax=Prymnesium parvum TaxID=97485 RepID=A0AB34IZQ8_PRYPA
MGSCLSNPMAVLSDDADPSRTLRLLVHSASRVPSLRPCAPAHTYCRLQLDGRKGPSARTSTATGRSPEWNQTLSLPCDLADAYERDVPLRLTLRSEDCLAPSGVLAHAVIKLRDLVRRPSVTLLMSDADGNAVNCGAPPAPCELTVSIVSDGASPWPTPTERPLELYPRHVMMMSRGTRGDVQPFVALAIGMAEMHGWMVTIVTELRWREWIKAKTSSVSRGRVRFLPSGGDTEKRMNIWIAQNVMFQAKSELAQWVMLGMSEADFFGSIPTFVHQLGKCQESACPVDLLMCGFTVCGAAMLCSEYYGVPLIPFVLQPSSIPSKDKRWLAIEPIESTTCCERPFTSHTALQGLKAVTEIGLPAIRRKYGLRGASTWPTLKKLNVPVLMPFREGIFTLPADFPSNFTLSDFIFLRTTHDRRHSGGTGLAAPIEAFLSSCHAKGRKVCLMSFSSMPVKAGYALGACVKMLSQSKHDHAIIFVGSRWKPRSVGAATQKRIEEFTAEGKLLEVESADFGVLFPHIDAFIVHGGLGTTVEALRTGKPVMISGCLLFDQRFWGRVCEERGVGPRTTHIRDLHRTCVKYIDNALEDNGSFARAAKAQEWGDPKDDGVATNVECVRVLLEDKGILPVKVSRCAPPDPHCWLRVELAHTPLVCAQVNAARRGNYLSPLPG